MTTDADSNRRDADARCGLDQDRQAGRGRWGRWKRECEIFLVAIMAVMGGLVVRAFCHIVFNETIPYTPFYASIVVATMYGRVKGGAIALVLAAIGASLWIPPFGQIIIQEPTDLVGLLLFLIVGSIVVGLCEAMLRARHSAEIATQEERRSLEREQRARKEAENANRLKDEFLAAASHELRTPLQAILGWTHLLMRSDISEPDRQQALEIIERNARLQSRLIEDLLDMSRIMAGKLRISPRVVAPAQIIDLALQTIATAAQSKQISIVRQFERHDLTVWADPDRLQQVLWNLLSNAIKFSPSGSRVTVALWAEKAGTVIEITDEGCGIDPEFLPHVFERFRQADSSGSRRVSGLGLGLAIVKELLELHGGSISADSAGLNKGTRMRVTLPPGESVLATISGKPHSASKELRGVRVLVVEDDAVTCELIARLLRQQGSDVVAVCGAADALGALDRFEPDVIVSDIAMPERDGYELLRQIRRREVDTDHRCIPAMALTALSSPEDRRRAFEAGFHLHLTKPVDPSELTEAVAGLAVR